MGVYANISSVQVKCIAECIYMFVRFDGGSYKSSWFVNIYFCLRICMYVTRFEKGISEDYLFKLRLEYYRDRKITEQIDREMYK